jgi:hypothetical protein
MKKTLFIIPTTAVLFCIPAVQGAAPAPPTAQAASRAGVHGCDFSAEILALDDMFRDAVVGGNAAVQLLLLSDDFVYTNPSGGVLNKTQALASTDRSLLSIGRIDLLNRVVRLHGTAATVTGDRVLVDAFFRPPGYPESLPALNISGTYRYTHTFMQTSFGPSVAIHRACPNTWQLVSQNLTGIGWVPPAPR